MYTDTTGLEADFDDIADREACTILGLCPIHHYTDPDSRGLIVPVELTIHTDTGNTIGYCETCDANYDLTTGDML